MAEPFKIVDTMHTVIERGSHATRRPLPAMAVRHYLDAIKGAYADARVDPLRTDPPQHMRAGASDAYRSLVQVGYRKNEATGYERGVFIACTFTGTFALHGVVEAMDGRFWGSQAMGFLDASSRIPIELTKGHEGSLAPITDMIAHFTAAGEFGPWVPESVAVVASGMRVGVA